MTPKPALISDVDDPMVLIDEWIDAAKVTEPSDYDAMSLATATLDGCPSLRMELLKGLEPDGFIFYTNKESRKGQQIVVNKAAAICFHWKTLRRQIRVEGDLSEVSGDLADDYFETRSRESCIAAWAADQSRPMANREEFEQRYQSQLAEFEGKDVPRPGHWSGFRLKPTMIEFWLDLPHRMHDRLCFTRDGSGWSRERLYP